MTDTFDPVEFGKSVGDVMREVTTPLLKRIEELEARQLERGEKGEPGEPGKDADPISLADVCAELLATDGLKTLIDLHVAEAVAALPVPENGKDGERGPEGASGAPGVKGDPGADGVGVAGAVIDRDGALTLTLTNGETKSLGVIVGKDGDAGKDGKDGADLTDVEIDYDGERTLTIRGKGGEITKHLPIPMDRGYYRDGMSAEKGDILTHDGNAWIALKDTSAKPCLENRDDWRLFARKGRDGAQGPAGKAYVAPAPVKLGDRNG